MMIDNIMVIRGESDPTDGEPLFWANDQGWVDLTSADCSTEDEVKNEMWTLPMGGEWMNMVTALSELIEWVEKRSNDVKDN